ncbi:hypothetical protein ASPVEDRAFT_57912 [Aspergillus versicolor CBS 583.65]|uniref:Glycosyl hydrolases family 2 sugar binding domain-containing protein n=1 Tax=Aspergillus versicolor CBS 583.65 TaxID=1036611 RepID=A0A1L9P2N0_ASPVE|nr:uncharacterized protein ASPVEDRAFT_57912 [Aspergillus versicolor CBS 583.65]OJI95758.1 hypothetical protein ASPVEDRAFT_57912 [Aspergillus versicolor CBS 583.65]
MAMFGWSLDWSEFKDPPVNVRPRFRYWLPDASVEVGPAVQDVARAKQVGAGGLEVLGFYGYETTPGYYVPVDWSTYSWGGEAWQTIFKALLQAHRENSLIMDFAIGASMGQGVPAELDNEGLAWDLTSFNFTVPLGGSFDEKIPGWGPGIEPAAGKLLAVIAGTAVSSVNTSSPEPGLPHGAPAPRIQVTLAADSLVDITSKVSSDGHLSINFPESDGIEHVVFVVYEHLFHHGVYQPPSLLGGPQGKPTSFLNNGSWVVDHFSEKGARVTTDFWDKYLLGNGTRELIAEVGNYAWEDSAEIPNKVFWTPSLPEVFRRRTGDEISKWLPILFHQNGYGSRLAPSVWWITDEQDAGNAHIADYRATLGELQGKYLKALGEWSKSLGVEFSNQVGYNMPVDMEVKQRNIHLVDAPECESLGFNNDIDAYRQYAGPANLAGKRVISSELGADSSYAYQQNFTRLLWEVNRSIVGSVNQFVLHGFPYSGQYPNTTWPGINTFVYFFSEMHGPHQPGWDYYRPALDYIARLSAISQTGSAKKDIAFYSKYTTYPSVPRDYAPEDLNQAGYTYEYLSPDNFDLPSAHASGGVLAPEQQGFRAMVVRSNDSMTAEGVDHLAQFARAGLPLIFFGGPPSGCLGFNISCNAHVTKTIDSISRLSNVHVVHNGGLADTLLKLHIYPRARLTTHSPWFTQWRHDPQTGVDYVFLFNNLERSSSKPVLSSGFVDFETRGTPYRLDPWTGQYARIPTYTRTKRTTRIFFELAEGQSVLLAFTPEPTRNDQLTFTEGPILDITLPAPLSSNKPNATTVKIRNGVPGRPSRASVTETNGKRHSLEVLVEPSRRLQDWTLTVEHWDPPQDHFDTYGTVKWNSTYRGLKDLRAWTSISDELRNASGRGFYSTTFQWGSGEDGDDRTTQSSGAYLELPPISHTVQIFLNSRLLPAVDIYRPIVDITAYLVHGRNKLEVIVATPLGNALRPVWKRLVTGGHFLAEGTENIAPVPVEAEYGLLGEVVVVPFVQCHLRGSGGARRCEE